ncbi:MAG: Crp/Fnr family transcriptional regulator [Acidobacteria bacterium]|nr:Crp/Fnr family transcriptional regulator [Acidobacteriota bacterium]
MNVLSRNSPSESDFGDLEQINLFRDIPNAELRHFGEWLHRKTFSSGTTLMTADQSGEVVYFIRSGTVKVHVEQADGSDVIISILGPGESVGEMSALDQQHRSASVATLEESDLLWMDRATFKRFLVTTPMLSHNLACLLSARLRKANEQIQSLATADIESRIARQLIGFADKYGQTEMCGDISIPVRLTQSDLANLVGATRESVNKIIVSYKERGFLSAGRDHHWTIHNRQFLANRCG